MPNYLVQVTIHQVISAEDGREADARASGFARSLEAESREVRYRLAPVDRPLLPMGRGSDGHGNHRQDLGS